MERRSKGTDVEDAGHSCVACGHGELRVARDDNHSVDRVLEGRNPVRNELSVHGGTRVAEVLSIFELTCFKRGVPSVIGDAQLEMACHQLRRP